jgi:hypothetical protein
MARPGVSVITRDAPPSSGPPIATGTAFVVGTADRGPANTWERIESMSDFERTFGSRQSYSYLYDALDTFFREGGGSAYVSRAVGPAAADSSVNLLDAGDSPTLLASASGPGASGNDLRIDVSTVGGVTTLTVKSASTGDTLETFSTSGGKDGLLGYTGFRYITLTDAHEGLGVPKNVTAAALTGGSDDLVNADYSAALAAFPATLGPGQVLAPGLTDATVHEALLLHASTHNRVALLDVPNTDDLGTLEDAADTARDTGLGSYGAMFGPWARIPGSAPNTQRFVPYSAVQAGLEARRDRVASQNIPAAGRSYPLQYVMALAYEFSDDDRTELIEYGVNLAHTVGGLRETYGYRSLADPDTDPNWVQFNYARLRMAITASAEDIGETFLFSQIDGKGLKLSEFGSAIAGLLLDFYVLGSLYGDTPAEAFRVDVGSSVNTAETIEAGELHAVAGVRMSPHAEMVVIEFVKTPITQAV